MIRGNKTDKKSRFQKVLIFAALVIVVFVVLQCLLPIGIGEVVGNRFAAFGTGGYPREIYGTEILKVENQGYFYYVLTDSQLAAFSTAGKKIFSVSHGYAHPVLKCSETRALLYDQGGTEFAIYNLRGNIVTQTCDDAIQTAAIGRNGTYAIVNASNSYASSASVYNLKNKRLYEWYSAKDIVNNIVVSRDGKKIAVSTISTVSGTLSSKVCVLKFDSPNAVQTFDLEDNVVCSLENDTSGFDISTKNSCLRVSWNRFERKDYSSTEELYISRKTSSGNVLVFNRSSNRLDNHIVIFNHKGKKLKEFDFDGAINDIAYANGHIYCISETTVYLLDLNGDVLCRKNCEYGAERLAVLGSESIAVITNSQISRMVLSN